MLNNIPFGLLAGIPANILRLIPGVIDQRYKKRKNRPVRVNLTRAASYRNQISRQSVSPSLPSIVHKITLT
jgi:hypothetical protein